MDIVTEHEGFMVKLTNSAKQAPSYQRKLVDNSVGLLFPSNSGLSSLVKAKFDLISLVLLKKVIVDCFQCFVSQEGEILI